MPAAAGYTAHVARRSERRAARKGTYVMPRTRLDRLLALLFALYCLLVLPPLVALQLVVYLLSAQFRPLLLHVLPRALRPAAHQGGANISMAPGGSMTARFVLMARAYYAGFGLGPDTLATRLALSSHVNPLLPRMYFAVSYIVSTVGFVLFRRDAPLVVLRRMYSRFLRTDNGTAMHARTCWLDDVVTAFAERHKGCEINVVVLGAGYDSRAYRLVSAVGPDASWFEVDAPGTQERKRRALRALGVESGHVRFVAVDFAEGQWMDQLVAAGFEKEHPTCFVWEGVTMYLGREDVVATLREVSECGAGSVIAFDYLAKSYVFDSFVQEAMSDLGEKFKFGMGGESDAIDLIGSVDGLELGEWLDMDEARYRYLPVRADGSDFGLVQNNGGYVLAMCGQDTG